jgi:hypothetical protein
LDKRRQLEQLAAGFLAEAVRRRSRRCSSHPTSRQSSLPGRGRTRVGKVSAGLPPPGLSAMPRRTT